MDVYFFIAAVLIILSCIVIFVLVRGVILRRKLAVRLKNQFGKEPDLRYEDGDFEHIAEYYFYSLAHGKDDFKIDEITWNDLNMDGVFVDMNATQTNCGEQILYNTLHTPVFDKESFKRRENIVNAIDANESLRVKLQLVFAELGRRRGFNVCEEFNPQQRGVGMLLTYGMLVAIFVALLVFTVISPSTGAPYLILSFVLNCVVYNYEKLKIDDNLAQLSYALGMIASAKKVEKLATPEISDYIAPLVQALKTIGSLSGMGAISMTPTSDDLSEFFGMAVMWSLIRYEISKRKIGAHYKELMAIYEVIGGLDCAVSIASYRRRLSVKCRPEIDFDSVEAFVEARGLVHPLIKNAVPNDFDTHKSVLLTGSNASGKSTYLKVIAINAIFAQTICVCLSQSYRASALRVYSSMALSDDLAAGESYYIVEIKSIGRIINAAGEGAPVICIVDEVLRGTNTVERIAASSEILRYIASKGALCIAATHDIELASILASEFQNYHFQKYIKDNAMNFDYKLHDGASTSRNAIKLLDIMGYDKEISQGASHRAEEFLKRGKWDNVEIKKL